MTKQMVIEFRAMKLRQLITKGAFYADLIGHCFLGNCSSINTFSPNLNARPTILTNDNRLRVKLN